LSFFTKKKDKEKEKERMSCSTDTFFPDILVVTVVFGAYSSDIKYHGLSVERDEMKSMSVSRRVPFVPSYYWMGMTCSPSAKYWLCTGGSKRGEMRLYDRSTNSITILPEMNEPRWDHTGTPLPNGDIVVIGGISIETTKYTNSVERFSLKTRTWSLMKPIPVARYDHCAVLYRPNLIFVAGGRHTHDAIEERSAFFYNVDTGESQIVAPMHDDRARPAACLLPDNTIFVIGGTNQRDSSEMSCERYDPDTNRWEEMPPLLECHIWLRAIMVNGKVVVFGINSEHIQVFCPQVQQWSILDTKLPKHTNFAIFRWRFHYDETLAEKAMRWLCLLYQ
jgi:hypothetical protein